MRLPQTRSKNPVIILRAVARAILGDPRRYNQTRFVERRHHEVEATRVKEEGRRFPPCGTTACIAGWALAVTGTKLDEISYSQIPGLAAKLLRLNEDAHQLFRGDAIQGPAKVGTKWYAQAGVAHIRRFVRTYYRKPFPRLKGEA